MDLAMMGYPTIKDPKSMTFGAFCTLKGIVSDRARFHAWTVGSEALDTTNFDADDWQWWYEAFTKWGDFADQADTQEDAIR